jgi:hypothetical protein
MTFKIFKDKHKIKHNNGMHKKRPLSAINVEFSAELNSEVLHFSIHLKEM